jgi:mannose-6-phosphate isomerase-like protein (cupin superfamily)
MRKLTWVLALVVAGCGGTKQSSSVVGGVDGVGGPAPGDGSEPAAHGSSESGGTAKGGESKPAGPAEKIEGALPETKDLKPFARRHECGAKGCNLAQLVPEALEAQLDKDAPIFMFEEVMPPKVSLLLPRHAGIDVYGVLLDGEISVLADDIKEKQKRVWRMNGFRAPGGGVNIYSKENTRMILAIVVAGSSGTVAEQIDKLKKKDKTVAWSKRSSPVVSFDLMQKPDLAWGGGAYHARLGLEESPASASFLMMSKNAPVAEHTHDKEWEFLGIVEGSGELARKTSGKVPIDGATFVAVKPGELHGFKPAGDRPTYAVQMYWPPGPEQRFKKLAEAGK